MEKSKKTTMKDIGKLVGVSQPTVSYVINKTASISDEIVKKVEKAIKELNYIPDGIARNLKQGKTNTIGLLIPDVDNSYFTEITKGIEIKLRENGFITFLCNTLYDEIFEKSYITSLIQQKVRGILLGYGLLNF